MSASKGTTEAQETRRLLNIQPELAELRCVCGSVEQESYSRGHEDLGLRERCFLRHGVVPRGKTRSEAIQSVALSALNRGWTPEQFRAAMLNRSNRGAAKIFEIVDAKGLPAAQAYLDRCWSKATQFFRKYPPIATSEEVTQQVQGMRSAILGTAWNGLTGTTDLAVLTAHLEIAEKSRSVTYTASVRQIAEAAGVGRDTVQRSHKRLAKFLDRLPPKDGSQTSRWKLKTALVHDSTNHPRRVEYCHHQRTSPAHDVWHPRALGKGCRRTWEALLNWIRVSELAALLSAKPRTIAKHLKRLRSSGLAQRTGALWHRIHRDLDEVAAELGTLGKAAARKRRHAAEREQYEKRRGDRLRPAPRSNVSLISETTGVRLAGQPTLCGNLEAALSYALQGLRVLPLFSIREGRCTCGKPCPAPGKHPIGLLVPHGVNDAASDPDLIRAWWRRCPDANIGVATGTTDSGLYLCVVDIDPRNGGNDSFRLLVSQHGIPVTCSTRTGGGGTHLLFTSTVRCRSCVLAMGIDFKGEGGYIVAPPSTHQSGQQYEWIQPLDKIAQLPDWMTRAISARDRNSGPPGAMNEAARESTADPSNTSYLARRPVPIRRLGTGRGEAVMMAEMVAPMWLTMEVIPR